MSMQYLLPSCYIHTTRYYPLLPATLLSLAVHSLQLLLIILTPDLHCVPPLLWPLLCLAPVILRSNSAPLLVISSRRLHSRLHSRLRSRLRSCPHPRPRANHMIHRASIVPQVHRRAAARGPDCCLRAQRSGWLPPGSMDSGDVECCGQLLLAISPSSAETRAYDERHTAAAHPRRGQER